MLYTLKKGEYVPATVLDIDRYLYYYNHIVLQDMLQYIDDMVYEDFAYSEANVALYAKENDTFTAVIFVERKGMYSDITASELSVVENYAIEILKHIDISVCQHDDFLNTNYETFYGEDTTEVDFKLLFVACAQLLALKLNISFAESLEKCNKIDIYGNYMQAESVEMIVEYAIKYRINLGI